jgi:hypothetical protein
MRDATDELRIAKVSALGGPLAIRTRRILLREFGGAARI